MGTGTVYRPLRARMVEYLYIHKGTINVYAQENAFKIFFRWYKTPFRMHKISPTLSPHCCRCSKELGLHISWACPLIQPFWKEVHRLPNQFTTFSLDYSPAQFLLHRFTISKTVYLHSLAIHMVNAAKICIHGKWRSSDPPTITNWFWCIQKTARMEELVHRARDTPAKFRKIWSCWLHFVTTDEYSKLIA